MARKSSKHKHLKGENGKRRCNRPSAHKRKGTMTRGRRRKTKFWKETKSDRGLNDRMQAWAAAKGVQKQLKLDLRVWSN